MYNEETDILFPPRIIPLLQSLRGDLWRDLVGKISVQEGIELDRLAFVLLMVRLGGCTSCQADSFRAMRGCTQCAMQTVRRFRGSDEDLLAHFNESKEEVSRFLKKKK